MKIYIITWQTKHGYQDYEVFKNYDKAIEFQDNKRKEIEKQKTNAVVLISKNLD